MAASKLTQIRQALAAQIKANVDGVNVSWFPGSGSAPPLIEVDEAGDSVNYQDTLGRSGDVKLRFTLKVSCDSRDAGSLVQFMDGLMSWEAGGIYEAVRSDRTLGGLVDQVVVGTAQRFDEQPHLAELPVEITLPKT